MKTITMLKAITMISIILNLNIAVASTRYAVATGNWNSTATWSAASGGASGASVPGIGDVVVIESGYRVTVSDVQQCDSVVVINSNNSTATGLLIDGGALTVDGNILISATVSTSKDAYIRLNNASSIVVNGNLRCYATSRTANFEINNTSTGTINGDLTLETVGSKTAIATVNNDAVLNLDGDVIYTATAANRSLVTLTGNGRLNITGNFDRSASGSYGELTCDATSTVNFNGAASQFLSMKDYGANTQNWKYGEILLNNITGVSLDTNLNQSLSTNTVLDDIRVQSGIFNSAGYEIELANGKTFEIANGATYNSSTVNSSGGMLLTSTTAVHSIGASSTVEFSAVSTQNIPNPAGAAAYGNLVVSGSSAKTLSDTIRIEGNLTMNGGNVILNHNLLILGASAGVNGSPGAASYIVADSTGSLVKEMSSPAGFTFPIGDALNYSPGALNFTSGTFAAGAYAGMRVKDEIHPNNTSTDNISRYWSVTASGISSYSCDAEYFYTDGDINGTESFITTGQWTGSGWNLLNPVDIANNKISGTVTNLTIEFTGGNASVLPVTLTFFRAVNAGGNVETEWETASELNSNFFSVERSADGVLFERVGIVRASGTTASVNRYSFTDYNPVAGTSYYRLVQTDLDGKTTAYKPVSVNTNVSGISSLKVYPNPVSGSKPFNVALNGFEDEKEILVLLMDPYGKEVYSKVAIQGGTMNVAFDAQRKLRPGIYFIIASDDNTLYREKLIIQ